MGRTSWRPTVTGGNIGRYHSPELRWFFATALARTVAVLVEARATGDTDFRPDTGLHRPDSVERQRPSLTCHKRER